MVKRILVCLIALAAAGQSLAAESPQQVFIKAWTGRPVVVTTQLHSLIYNERGKLGTTRSGMREGLVVVTPSQGTYFQFDGRQGRDAVVEHDLQRLVGAISAVYEGDSLDVRSYRRLEPLAINRYDRGVELVVSGVRVDRDQVRFELVQVAGEGAVTSLTVKWPAPLSKSFSERGLVEDLLRRFVEIKQS